MVGVGNTISLHEVNALARSMLTFASDYGNEREVLSQAQQQLAEDPSSWAYLGPTRATSIIACIPAYVDASGQSVAGAAGAAIARPSLGASGHLDADTIDLAALEEQSRAIDEFEIPEGAVAFDPKPADIATALSDMSLETEAVEEVELPTALLTDAEVEALMAERQPCFVPLEGPCTSSSSSYGAEVYPPADAFSKVVQRRLSNGMRVNYRHSGKALTTSFLFSHHRKNR